MTKYIALADIAESLGRTYATVKRWTDAGNSDGRRLLAQKIGGRWYTTEDAWQEFVGEPPVESEQTRREKRETKALMDRLANYQ